MKLRIRHHRKLKKKIFAGFTLLELLVVIAIVAVLAAIILAVLNTTRAKAQDTKTRQVLSAVRTAAASEKTSTGTFQNICVPGTQGNTTITSGDSINTLKAQQGLSDADITCVASADTFAVVFPLNAEDGYWCVDYTGVAKKVSGKTPAAAPPYACDTLVDGSGQQQSTVQIKLSLLGGQDYGDGNWDTTAWPGGDFSKYQDPGVILQSDESIDYYGEWNYVCVGSPQPGGGCYGKVTYTDAPTCQSGRPAYLRTYSASYKGASTTGTRMIAGSNGSC